jgi:hypothetical protein
MRTAAAIVEDPEIIFAEKANYLAQPSRMYPTCSGGSCI